VKRKVKREEFLIEVERLAQSRALRLTPIRRTILELMANANKALGAYDILEIMQKEKPDFKPITVYRTLEFLLENGLIHRVESANAYVICYHPGQEHRSQLLICDHCGSVKEVEAEAVSEQLDKIAKKAGFTEVRQTVETHGLCRSCRD
jgi:Fur family zinc uptake transcriptional regulator